MFLIPMAVYLRERLFLIIPVKNILQVILMSPGFSQSERSGTVTCGMPRVALWIYLGA